MSEEHFVNVKNTVIILIQSSNEHKNVHFFKFAAKTNTKINRAGSISARSCQIIVIYSGVLLQEEILIVMVVKCVDIQQRML